MAVLVDGIWWVKGCAEAVLPNCSHDSSRPLDSVSRKAIIDSANTHAATGLRILFMAYGSDRNSLCYVGWVGLSDPIRPSVPACIATLHAQSIKTLLITGDSGVFYLTQNTLLSLLLLN